MTTSPDESRPSGVSAIVVPDVLRPRIDDFLRSLGCTVETFPWHEAPVPMFIAIPQDPDTAERKSRFATVDLGRSTSPVEEDTSTFWTPVSNQPGLLPLPNPPTLPAYVADYLDPEVREVHQCAGCEHDHGEHNGFAYTPPLGPTTQAEVVVVVCMVDECACLTRVEPPIPV